MARIKVTGIVVDQASMGEKDIRLTLLSAEQGNISVIAKGAKAPGSKQRSAASLFAWCDYVLETGRSFAYIREYEIRDLFYPLREDPDRFLNASAAAETARLSAVDGENNAQLLRLLIRCFRAMQKEQANCEMILLTFLMRLMVEQGLSPETDVCVRCSRPYDRTGTWHLPVDEGGLVCEACLKTQVPGITPGAVFTLQHIRHADAGKLFQFQVSDAVHEELESLIPQYMFYYTGIRPKSLKVLWDMQK